MKIQRTNLAPRAEAKPVVKPKEDDSKKEEKGFVDEYVSSVRTNFKKNGAFSVMMSAGIEGWLGGFMGQMAGNMVSGFFPGAVGAAIGEYAGAAGATMGFLDGLSRDTFF